MAILVPTIHPAVPLRTGQQITDVIAGDLGKAWRISQEGPKLEEHILWVLPGNPMGIPEMMRHALAWMQHWRRKGARLGVDVETSALDYYSCKLYSIAIGEAESGVGIAFTLHDFHTMPQQLEAQLIYELKLLLADTGVEKVFHNAPFDLAVLRRRDYPVHGPIWDTQGIHHLIQPDIPHNLGWVGHSYLDVGPWKLDHQSGKMANTNNPQELLIYNTRDAIYTAMLVEPMQRVVLERGMTNELIQWQSAYAELATHMELAGLPVNLEKRRQMAAEMKERMSRLIHEMREYLGWADFNPMSDSHRREALFGQKYAQQPWGLGLQATLLTKKLQQPSTGYRSIIDYLEHPFVRALVNYVETRQTYATQYQDGTLRGDDGQMEGPGAYQRAIQADGRLHAAWKPNTLNSPRFGSSPNCMSADTEVLTIRGWVPFPEAAKLELPVYQYNPASGEASLALQPSYVAVAAKEWVHIKTQQLDHLSTADHRMLIERTVQKDHEKRRELTVMLAKEAGSKRLADPILLTRAACVDDAGAVDPPLAWIRVLCVCQADGWRRTYGNGEAWAFYFTKKRKVDRLEELLTACGSAAIWYKHPLPDGTMSFYLKECVLKQWIDSVLTARKEFPISLLGWGTTALRAFVEELPQWDGRSARGSEYSSVVKSNVDIVQAAAMLSGCRAGAIREFFGNKSKVPCYQLLSGMASGKAGFRHIKHTRRFTEEAVAYCVTVPTGFIFIRRNGKACITGNCQNQRIKDRAFIEAPFGRVFVASDKDQLELRLAACLAGVEELIHEMRNPDGDPHTLAARHVYAAQFEQAEAKQRKLYRTLVKNVTYASLYLAGVLTVWRTIRNRKQLDAAVRAAMTLSVVRHIHSSYFGRYTEFPRRNEAMLRFVTQHGYWEIPPLGRRRYCPMLPAPATDFANWSIQALGADIVTSEMCRIQYDLRKFEDAWIIKHGHDEVVVECREQDAEAVQKIVDHHFGATPLEGPKGVVYMTAKSKIGKNLEAVK